jgi:uncharacterized protein (DUF2336 family)
MRALSPAALSPPGASRAERLFHAAISAFCALNRPSRAEIAQIDDLTQPLLDLVSPAAKRFAAAAFSESPHAPPGLVRRLCDEAIDVAAPLLVRSPLLSDIDLVGVVGRHGASHAQAVARRAGLHPAIAQLVRALQEGSKAGGEAPAAPRAADIMRQKLRAMMANSAPPREGRERALFSRLRDTALDGHRPFFETALADATGLSLASAGRVAADPRDALPRALHALGLTAEQAFLVTAAVHPQAFAGLGAIRGFAYGFAAFADGPEERRLKRA